MALDFVPISISAAAQQEIKKIMASKGIPSDYSLRVGVKGGGGCGGAQFLLGFDKPKEGDTQFNINGIEVLIEKKQTMYLVGLEVDFVEDADARGFTFINPTHHTS
ncbi:iron-sulfur cluster assembly accessory protein [Cytophagales bacterium LB-30]|uniref:Iron-sulfur cluster assembly accessory protein n=1 Tax=Shiella aurantiaca TaxID=3058365 RepID=A0ABT8F7U8_9BACT|nr:iron-sulfur cluster assembly accessory protein [Shiella aurantiaca]MDN4166517.1 iron-sulfur cluster assembly accessory protein [Shiella aurantiaca]